MKTTIRNIGKIVFFSIALCLFQNCQAQKKIYGKNKSSQKNQTVSEEKNMKNTYTFQEGENRFLKDFDTNFTFKSIVEDSRCPKEVKCIWQGVGTVEVEVIGIFTRPKILKLSTLNDVKKGYENSVEFNNLIVSLVELNPYPSKKIAIEDRKYSVVLKIIKKNTD